MRGAKRRGVRRAAPGPGRVPSGGVARQPAGRGVRMRIEKIHHVAYRCHDAKQTVQWYGRMPNMGVVPAVAGDAVPSTQAPDRCLHVFLDAGGGNVPAFFELPTQAPMGRDPNTPDRVQHIAFKAKDRATLPEYQAHLEAEGVPVPGGTDHGAFHSIYLLDPNGHRVELACPDPDEAAIHPRLDAVKWDMLEEWPKTRRAPRHAAFLHQPEFQS